MRENLLKKVKKTLEEIEPSAEVYLFGSRARMDSRKDSDWDFLILIDGVVDTARTDRIRRRLYEIEWETGEILSSIVRNRLEWNSPKYKALPLRENVEREGMPL
jgi:predicted nucleotidyltransferase